MFYMGYGLFSFRTWIYISQIFSVFLAIGSVVGMMHLQTIFDVNTEMASVDVNEMVAYNWVNIATIIIFGIAFATVAKAVVLIYFIHKNDDESISNNRFAVMALSAGFGSLWGPIIMRALPNTSYTNTISPKFYITKMFSMVGVVFGIGLLTGFAATYLPIKNSANPITLESADYKNVLNTMLYCLYVGAGILGFSLITGALFWPKSAAAQYEAKSGIYGMQQFFAVFFSIAVTLLMFVTMLGAVLEILNALGRVFGRNENMFERLIAILYLPLIIAYQGFLIVTCARVVKATWSNSEVITYGEYERLARARNNNENRSYN